MITIIRTPSAENHKEFLTRLRDLLAEYDADIDWTCDPCSDTHGIYDDAIVVSMSDTEVLRTQGGLSSRTITESLD